MKRKLLVAVMSIIMTTAFLPLIAFADSATTVTDESSLKTALAAGGEIELAADITVSAPLYVTKDATILTTEKHSITRNGFSGDLFIVGQTSDGKDVIGDQGGRPVTLNLGDSSSNESDMLVIDGNNTAVRGTMIYVANSSTVNIYTDTTIQNCNKTGNTTVKSGDLSKGTSAGGAAAIIASGTLNLRGGKLINNKVARTDTVSAYGGAIYNYGTFKMYGGSISDCSAYIGGAVYNYRTAKFINGTVSGCSANNGGALYQADSQYAQIIVGNDKQASSVVFSGNSATENGGVFYSGHSEGKDGVSGFSVYADANAQFTENTSAVRGGAIATYGTVNIKGATFSKNHTDAAAIASEDGTSQYGGGAVYTSGSQVNIEDTVFEKNTSGYHAGALALYGGSHAVIKDSAFTENEAPNKYGAAIHLNKSTMDVSGTTFSGNTAVAGGAVCFYEIGSAGESSFTDCDFDNNTATECKSNGGGAIYCKTSSFSMNGGSFSNNECYSTTNKQGSGGAIGLFNAGTCVINNVSFNDNYAVYRGGGIYVASAGSGAAIYNCEFKGNECENNGGALSIMSATDGVNVVNTLFDGNIAHGSGDYNGGGAAYWYQSAGTSIFFNCTFKANGGATYGGGINNNASKLELYNTTAEDNSGGCGGFLYANSSSTITINGINLKNDGGSSKPVWSSRGYIGGNPTVNINKTNVTDANYPSITDYDKYWQAYLQENGSWNSYNGWMFIAPENIHEITDPAPATYIEAGIPQNPFEAAPEAEEVSNNDLEAIFALAEDTDPETDSSYNPGAKLNNDSNFQSRSTASYEVNGGTVTADSFVYESGKTANNPNVGEGILIFQAMQYKKAHPDKDVSIDISSYRFSAEAAVCINRNSDYFGYMRTLPYAEYDKYGFVRISRLLVGAAEMGIDVNVIAQRDASTFKTGFVSYFDGHMNDACLADYAEGQKVSDYLTVYETKWDYSNKAAADLMHTKSCAVTNYRDKDGVDHGRTVWLSSSNLDNVKADGRNDLDWKQTGIIISDHADIYRVTKNYLDIIKKYPGKSQVYKFRNEVNRLATEQIDAINAGETVDADKQIVYTGGPQDKVFELYFSAIGGDNAKWDETYNMFTKQIRNLSESEDYIMFAMNNPKFNDFSLSSSMQKLIARSFVESGDINNRLYVAIGGSDEDDESGGTDFNTALFDGLTEGVNIYSKKFDLGSGKIHSKDMLLSYVMDGQRNFVTMITSMNMHEGSSSYQSNFALVVKENSNDSSSVFYNVGKYTTENFISDNVIDSFELRQSEYTYSGSANEPGVKSVKSGENTVKSAYYDVQYTDNVNAGTGTVKVIGNRQYTGTVTRTFTIKPAEINDDCVTVFNKPYNNGEPVISEPVVEINGVTMTAGKDYEVSYENNTDIGWATVTVKGKGNCIGEVSKRFFITSSEKAFNEKMVTVEGLHDVTYTGEAITYDVTVKINGEDAIPGEEYSITWENNTHAGKAALVVHGEGDYSGEARFEFNIIPVELSTCTINDFEDVTYTGEAFKPAVTVKNGDITLVENTDYTVDYDTLNAGTAKITVSGINDYKGEVVKNFTISPLSINDSSITVDKISSQLYNGKAYDPAVTVRYGEMALKSGTDYTVTYKNDVNAGTATVVIEGTGNFTGTRQADYEITPMDIGDSVIKLEADSFKYTGAEIRPSLTVTYDGQVLKEDENYIVSYYYNTDVGSAIAEVEGIGNYGEYNSATFDITKATPTVTLSATKLYCTGKTVKPTVKVKLGTTVMTDAKVTIPTSKNPGKYTVKVSGDNYNSVSKTYQLLVKPTSIASLTKLSKGFTVKAKKLTSTYSTGYQVRYSLKKSMSGAKTVTISSKASTVSKKVTKLKAKKTYYVQVRTVKKIGTVKKYSAWSAKKTVKTK